MLTITSFLLGNAPTSGMAQTPRVGQDAGTGATEPWPGIAPEQIPPVTVRWEDPNKRDVVVVEGADYQCRVSTLPLQILTLKVGGEDLLGAGGATPGFIGGDGKRYFPAPADVTPSWQVWRGQSYQPVTSARARMNVWSAGPYYWDAHLLDIPFLTQEGVDALRGTGAAPAVAEWTFDSSAQGWAALHSCTFATPVTGILTVNVDGPDPYFQSPALDAAGPVAIRMRVRSSLGGGMAVYWSTNTAPGYAGSRVTTTSVGVGEWQDVSVVINTTDRLTRFRIDPPGETGVFEVDRVSVHPVVEPGPEAKPLRGELILHAYADRMNIELRLAPEAGQTVPAAADWLCDAPGATAAAVAGRPVLSLPTAAARRGALLGVEGAQYDPGNPIHWTAPLAPASDGRPGAWWVFRPSAPEASLAAAFADELNPLPAAAVEVADGIWQGYDAPSGLYHLHANLNPAAFNFENTYRVPALRTATGVRLKGDGQPRNMIVKCFTGVGMLEGAVLADRWGFPLPVPAFVAKNFAGEKEEPDDSAFGDIYFPLTIAPADARDFQVLGLFQNWGNHPLKQVSSIRFFQIYWHLSTGIHETTCFTHDWLLLNNTYVQIPDFRPMTGIQMDGQPNNDCQAWPGFLQYESGGARVRLIYEQTTFNSINPNLADFVTTYHSSDDAVRASIQAIELPQPDETRTFLRLRYDWTKPVALDGDARLTFRWLNMNEKFVPESLVWSDAADAMQVRAITADGQPMLTGEALAAAFPVIGVQGVGDKYSSLMLVRSFRARLGGVDVNQVNASARFGAAGSNTNYWFGAPMASLTLQAGDFIEADVMVMPHGEQNVPEYKPARERVRFGSKAPRVVSVATGAKLADFPARIRAQGDVAAFTVEGGESYQPFIVEGMSGWQTPLLWVGGTWQDQQLAGGDGWQVDGDGQGGYRYTFAYPLRKGARHVITLTRAECTTGIARLRAVNGFLELESPDAGVFTLKAPALFGPGRNTVTAGSGIYEFRGNARVVRQLPLAATVTAGSAGVTVNVFDAARIELLVDAAATLTVSQLEPRGAYRVTYNGQSSTETADGAGRLSLQAPAPGTVTIERIAAVKASGIEIEWQKIYGDRPSGIRMVEAVD